MCSTGGAKDLVLEGQDDQTLLGLVTQILTAVGTHPLGEDLTDEVLTASVTRLHELETMAAAEKLRRIAEVDPDALARRDRRAWANRRLTLHTDSPDGMVCGQFALDPVGGATLIAALDAQSRNTTSDDDRTFPQRQADALVELARRALDAGELAQMAAQRPHVLVITTAENSTTPQTHHQHTRRDRPDQLDHDADAVLRRRAHPGGDES
jgi:hypothetical protein